jgi:Ser/Thr protein kinase RdoA (MazF antagonist)
MDPLHLSSICEEFGLGEPISVTENHEGVLNRNFDLTTTKGRYFVKSVRDKRKDSIPVIAATESYMAEGGIPTVCMLHTKTGDLYLPHESEVYTVYPYIPNEKISSVPYVALGSMLARIHQRGDGTPPRLLMDIHMVEKDPARVEMKLTEYREKSQEKDTPADLAFRRYIDLKRSLLSSLTQVAREGETLMHGDYHARNVLFASDGSIVGICDWEKAERAPRAYEVARSIQYICFEGRGGEINTETTSTLAAAREFLSAYRSTYPISDEAMRDGFAMRFRKLIMSFWIEERYYDYADERSNKFIQHETRLIEEFADSSLVEKIIS